jgi:hypothetical protein
VLGSFYEVPRPLVAELDFAEACPVVQAERTGVGVVAFTEHPMEVRRIMEGPPQM